MAKSAAFVIYHNPRCGKSRSALTLLQEKGITPQIVEYLKNPPTRDELKALVRKLRIKPEQLVRKGEDVFKQKHAGKVLNDDQWLDALVRDPILIERPIIVRGERAVIGRPPEKVQELL
jgi:arsenate reductase (glutaredoxin)